MKLIFTSLALAALLNVQQSSAQDISALASQIANVLGYPVERLVIEDKTSEYNEKTKGKALLGIKMSSETGSFAPTMILVTQAGGMLSAELAKWGADQIDSGSVTVRRFEMGQGAYGYSGLGLVGPGGSVERILATWPARRLDLQIQITTPREGIEFDDSTKTYHELVMNGGPQLAEKLVKCMEHLAGHVEKADIQGSATAQQTLSSQTSQSKGIQSSQSTGSKLPSSATQTNLATDGNATSSMPWSIIIVLIVAATALLWLLVKKRK